MPKFEHIDGDLRDFIETQKVFFVATAAPEGRVNVAPKGMDTLRVLGPNRIVWLNLTGSENETAAHLVRKSPRIPLMWCSLRPEPLILRVYGHAKVFHPRSSGWSDLVALFPSLPGARRILDRDVDLVLTSCGFGVPLFDYVGQRDTLREWAEKKGPEGVREFWEKRTRSALTVSQATYSQMPTNPCSPASPGASWSMAGPSRRGRSIRPCPSQPDPNSTPTATETAQNEEPAMT